MPGERCFEREDAFDKAARDRLREGATHSRRLEVWRDAARVPCDQARPTAVPGTDRTSAASWHDLAALHKAPGRNQGARRVWQDLAGGSLDAGASTDR